MHVCVHVFAIVLVVMSNAFTAEGFKLNWNFQPCAASSSPSSSTSCVRDMHLQSHIVKINNMAYITLL